MSFADHSQFRKVAPARIDQRGEMRHSVFLKKAKLRGKANHEEVEAALVDLSSFGCRLAVEGRYPAGSRLMLRFFDREPMAATAVWGKGGQIGCRFETKIECSLFRALTISEI
ncbi:MAG: PilZ domain-containing protein [Sphingorhabdus sp.]